MKQKQLVAAVLTGILVFALTAVARGRLKDGAEGNGAMPSLRSEPERNGRTKPGLRRSEEPVRERRGAGPRLFDEKRNDVNKAATLLKLASFTSDPAGARLQLERALMLDLPGDDPVARKILFGIHSTLAGLYDHAPDKRLQHATLAERYAVESLPEGGSIVALNGPVSGIRAHDDPRPLLFGVADVCQDGTTVPLAGVGESFDDTLTIESGGDFDWYTLELGGGDPAAGQRLLVETVSDTPENPSADDSELRLFSGCDDSGEGAGLLAFDDDGGQGLMSLLETPCLTPGTYYLRVAGFNEVEQADNIGLQIASVENCDPIEPDAFEPDGDRDLASTIAVGQPQTRSLFPPGDSDWARFQLEEDSLVRLRTACGFPSVFNDFTDCENPPEFDTVMNLWYSTATTTGGLCNQSATGVPGDISTSIGNACTTDLDCDFNGNGLVYPEDLDDLQDPLEGFPACLPWSVFSADGRPVDPDDNPLAFNDDADFFGGDLGSDLTLCLPRTLAPSPSLSVQSDPSDEFHWYVQVGGWSATGNPSDSLVTHDYELLFENLGGCDFEQEPNGDLYRAAGDDDDDDDDDLALDGTPRHGIWDFSATEPGTDHDLYRFDVATAGVVRFETDGYDPIAVDTFIEIWVGPDAGGEFLFTGFENDDISVFDRRSRLEAALVPACEAVGRDCGETAGMGESEQPAPAYFLNVTSAFVQPNFPYEVRAERLEGVVAEFDDIADCSNAARPLTPGDVARAAVDSVCDFDGYRFTLDESRYTKIRTTAPLGDTSIQLVDCDSGALLACDDDSGIGFASAIEGCLPGGREYCVRVRAFSGFSIFDYELEVEDAAACDATSSPALLADGVNACSDPSGKGFDTFAGCNEDFATCDR